MDDQRARALKMAEGLSATPGNLQRVAMATSDEVARWAFGQWELRARARAKFAHAERMLFVREALEQATHERVAEYHASRFPPGALVADLTVGIGADLSAFAARGPAIGFELDPERAFCAEFNVTAWKAVARAAEDADSEVGTTISITDCFRVPWEFEYAFADPARRVEGRRTLDPADFSPDPVELARRMERLRLGGIKLTPLLPDAFLESLGPCVEFVSFGGECREALVWTGREATAGRWAVQVESGERLPAGGPSKVVEEPTEFLYEADPAAIRAHALGTLCGSLGLVGLGDSNGYLTGVETTSPWLKSYRVLYHGKADVKRTRAALRELGAATPEVKQRGAGIDVTTLRKQLGGDGTRSVYVVVWPNGRSLRHTVVGSGIVGAVRWTKRNRSPA